MLARCHFSQANLKLHSCTKIVSDLSSLHHVKNVAVSMSQCDNLHEKLFGVCWAPQLRWFSVSRVLSVFGGCLSVVVVADVL
jgi:hypothetical protein